MNNNQSSPLISVIVPIYKIERYVGLCIESIINQDCRDLEIILIDDGSPDRCPDICDLYKRKDNRIKVIHKRNGGLVSARKAGLSVARGKYIGYVDGDDWIGPDFYSSLLTAICNSDADVAIAGQERVFFDKHESLKNNLSTGVYQGSDLECLFSRMLSISPFYNIGIFTYVWNKLFKREVLYQAQMNVDDRIFIGEDAACTYPVLLASSRICIINNCSYHYRQREDSMLKRSAPFEHELPSIKILRECMLNGMNIFDKNGRLNLQAQIDDYILSILIIRSGGLLKSEKGFAENFPFGANIFGRRVVIFSAGTFGQQLRTRLLEANHCKIVGWFDDDYWECRRCGLDVDPVDEIMSVTFDYTLVATVNSLLANEIKLRLIKLGVENNKILTINCSPCVRRKALEDYLSCC